jgi:hypothetical protein
LTDPYEVLSDDNHVAFLQLEREFRIEMEAAQEDRNSDWSEVTANYMNNTKAAAEALEIDALENFAINTRHFGDHRDNFNDFLRAVNSVIVQMRVANARSRKAMSVGLSEVQKTKIHHLIEKIRGEVEQSNSSDPKKEKIFDILSLLGKEVSKDRTRYERFADLARSLAGLSGDIEREGARPWWPWFEKIMGLIDDAKESEPQLPKPPEIKKIEAPRKELPKPGNRDLNGDIPF